MESNNFRITVDLSNFFSDYRSRVKIFIDENIKTIKDIENKLVSLFEIDEFHLTSGNEYLPSSEDVRILQPNEVLSVIRAETVTTVSEKSSTKARKRKSHKIEENSFDIISFHNCPETKKKKKNLSSYTENDIDFHKNTNSTCTTNDFTVNSKKNKKSKRSCLENQNENSSKITENDSTNRISQEISEERLLPNEYIPKENTISDNSTNINKGSAEVSKYVQNNNGLNISNEYKCKGNLPSYVKKFPIPTITHKYLSEKKVNIVKIDVVDESSRQYQLHDENKNVENSENKSSGNVPFIISENYEASSKTNLEAPEPPKSNGHNIPIINKNNLIELTEDNKISSTYDQNQQQISESITKINKKDTQSSNTKRIFFFNSVLPRNEDLLKSDNQKTERQIYQQKEFTLSDNYEATNSANLKVPKPPVDNEPDLIILNKNNSTERTEDNKLCSTYDNDELFDSLFSKKQESTKLGRLITESQKYKQKYFTHPKNIASPSYISPNTLLNRIEHGLLKPNIPNKNDDGIRRIEEELTSKIESTPTKKDNAGQKANQSGDNSDIIKDDSCDLSGLLSTDVSSIHKSISAMSGLQDLPSSTSRNLFRPKQISGIGHLLEELKSQHSSPYTTLEDSECSEFITKRKRKRVRKRNNPKPQKNIATETPVSTSSNYSEVSLNIQACPSLHVKYEYDNEDDNNVKIVNLIEGKVSENIVETINITSDKETSIINESSILKAPLMTDMLPKMGDIIAFKIIRMTENYTPDISSFITGRVVKLEEKNVKFDIIAGLDQCQEPSGKFSVENDGAKNGKNVCANTQISFNWDQLVCPRLIFP